MRGPSTLEAGRLQRQLQSIRLHFAALSHTCRARRVQGNARELAYFGAFRCCLLHPGTRSDCQ